GITGAEIIDRTANAQSTEALECLGGLLHIAHEGAFSNFQFKKACGKPRFVENGGHLFDQIIALELDSRNIDRHWYRTISRLLPYAIHTAGFTQHPLTDGDDQPHFFGKGNEIRGRHHAAIRGAPAKQGFGPYDPAAEYLDLGLIMQQEFVECEGIA